MPSLWKIKKSIPWHLIWLMCLFRARKATHFHCKLNFYFRIISIHLTFISSYNFGHEVQICIKMILHFCANWYMNFLLFPCQKSGNKFQLMYFICKLMVKMLCIYPYEMFSSFASSWTVYFNESFLHVFEVEGHPDHCLSSIH